MRERRFLKRWLAAFLALALLWVPLPKAEAASYSKVDAFEKVTTIKGMQGAGDSDLPLSSYGGLQHSIISINLDECIFSPDHPMSKAGAFHKFEFEGDTFYFGPPPGLGFASICNKSDATFTMIFLLRWHVKTVDDGYVEDNTFLIDEASREEGHNYYAPAVGDSYGAKAIRAFWQWFMEYLAKEGLRIDHFVLGNEVNMPGAWHYSGSIDPETVATKYADAFYGMYSGVRKYSDTVRCSVCLDHSWQNSDENGFGGKEFLGIFDRRLREWNGGQEVNWSLAYHLYPAMLYDTRIWNEPEGLNPRNESARIIDGRNLHIMTDYIRETYGEEHRIMLTEQGFTVGCGNAAQAACLAYSYYAAMYDPMVDSFIINVEDASNDKYNLNFGLSDLAAEVFTKLGSDDPKDRQDIDEICLPVIGVDSWSEIIPHYGETKDKIELKPAADGNWYYYVNDEVDTSFNGLVENDLGTWYVKNGVIDFAKTGLVEDGTGWWYVEGGKVTYRTGLVCDDAIGWWYVEDGKVTYRTGLVNDEYVGWWYVENGAIDFGRTGLVFDEYVGWWYVRGGSIAFDYTGPVLFNDMLWSVVDGGVNFGTGLVFYDDAWHYVNGGIIYPEYTGLVFFNDAWWFVNGGVVDNYYVGLVNDAELGWWYVSNGMVDFGYTGFVAFGDTQWYVAAGRLCNDYTGLVEDNGVWWYLTNGALYLGGPVLVEFNGTWWYVNGGAVDFGYTGIAQGPDGNNYNVVGGAVVF